MQSKAPDVTTYINEAPEERRAALTTLRNLCLKTLEGYEEAMGYGMPGYSKNGIGEVGFASQKNYISLYILKEAVVNAYRDQLKGLSVGKGCIRYSRPEKMDFEVIETLLRESAASEAPVC